ncbi:MAG: hypothetical protein A4E73_02110 [Syntrophaceae bacterium PtaU1.Bin231]|nr:MAG: hypothetical protein A4E73_02110 [Syntrophaceae bacterium PtaU1.Bin231]
MDKRIGTVSIIITSRVRQAPVVNAILSEYGDIIIGRMGIPYPPKKVHVISLIVHGTTDEIGAMTGKLGGLKGIQVKSALTRA